MLPNPSNNVQMECEGRKERWTPIKNVRNDEEGRGG
jgi:hypothetical protein